MSFNDLPEECLLHIFGLINELDDLLNCYKVCSKWSDLIAERTRKVKYLIEHPDWWLNKTSHNVPFDYVYYRTEEPIDATCLSTLFQNLMIADFSKGFRKKVKYEDIVTLIKKIKPLQGLIHLLYKGKESILQYCDELEMVSTHEIEECLQNNGVKIKQLHLLGYQPYFFKKDAHFFPDIERLHIYFEKRNRNAYYYGPVFRRLKIVELGLSSDTDLNYAFQFIDSCPNLQSAYIYLQYYHIFAYTSKKHESLQDLVLEFCYSAYNDSFNWDEWARLFKKYPNLKHLAMRRHNSLDKKQIEQLVCILPNLVLLDVRECPKVTQEDADYVQDYNKLHGRSIKFYFDENYDEILSDWPQLSLESEKISQGFDFMKHCFLKDFYMLSTFLIPDVG